MADPERYVTLPVAEIDTHKRIIHYMNRGDVWTLEMRDRNQKDLELFEPFKQNLKKKIAVGAVSHRTLQADRQEDVAAEIRKALKYIPAERLIVSSDCGFGRQGCNREIAFYKASAIAQGCNIIRRELGLPVTYVPAADPSLQVDVVPGRDVPSIRLSASRH